MSDDGDVLKNQRKLVMKAAEWRGPFEDLRYPLLASPKLDGVRAIKRGGRLLTQNGLPVRNAHVREWCEAYAPEGADGELVLLDDMVAPMRHVQSAVSSADGQPRFAYVLFDLLLPTLRWAPFVERLEAMVYACAAAGKPQLAAVGQTTISGPEALRDYAAARLQAGFEGTMTRDPDGAYRMGRAPACRQLLLKHKTHADEEALVLGVEEEMENTNERDDRGRRTNHKDGKVGKGRLGKVLCRFTDGAEFRCGSGFDAAEREFYWRHPELIVGHEVTVKYQPPRAAGEAPRFPVFKCVRQRGT